MQFYSENQVRQLNEEFKGLKKYVEKLSFFDRLFGIIPFSFPEFDPQLGFLFQNEKSAELLEIFKKERNNPSLTNKTFSFRQDFIFNIKPANSNSAAYSNYILSNFLSRQPAFEEWIRQKKSPEKPIEYLLDDANAWVNRIENCLQNEYDKSFQLQCMSVFYKGFYVTFCNLPHIPDKKRKFVELFLYAQGIIYANYIQALKTALHKSRNPVDFHKPALLDLTGKLGLMQELGIIDFLRSKYAGLDPDTFEDKLAEIICQLTGEYADQQDQVIRIMKTMYRRSTSASAKSQNADLRKKLLQFTSEK